MMGRELLELLLLVLIAWGAIAPPVLFLLGSRFGFREAERRLRGALARRRSVPFADRCGRMLRSVGR